MGSFIPADPKHHCSWPTLAVGHEVRSFQLRTKPSNDGHRQFCRMAWHGQSSTITCWTHEKGLLSKTYVNCNRTGLQRLLQPSLS